nr:MAG TPA: Lactococcin-like family [Caudoviricetes sp.]
MIYQVTKSPLLANAGGGLICLCNNINISNSW